MNNSFGNEEPAPSLPGALPPSSSPSSLLTGDVFSPAGWAALATGPTAPCCWCKRASGQIPAWKRRAGRDAGWWGSPEPVPAAEKAPSSSSSLRLHLRAKSSAFPGLTTKLWCRPNFSNTEPKSSPEKGSERSRPSGGGADLQEGSETC